MIAYSDCTALWSTWVVFKCALKIHLSWLILSNNQWIFPKTGLDGGGMAVLVDCQTEKKGNIGVNLRRQRIICLCFTELMKTFKADLQGRSERLTTLPVSASNFDHRLKKRNRLLRFNSLLWRTECAPYWWGKSNEESWMELNGFREKIKRKLQWRELSVLDVMKRVCRLQLHTNPAPCRPLIWFWLSRHFTNIALFGFILPQQPLCPNRNSPLWSDARTTATKRGRTGCFHLYATFLFIS